MEKYSLGIDVGTTGTKTLLFSADGKLLGRAYREYPLYTPKPGFGEQSPADWWKAVTETVREVCSNVTVAWDVAEVFHNQNCG